MKEINFSLWCDFLERDFINSEFIELIQNGTINGATSNPSIFKNAICNSKAYSELKEKFGKKDTKKLYEILATNDIKMAASKMLINYAKGDDGFVSIEVDPNLTLASDIIEEGKRLYNAIKMPNVMIKIPAISSGFEAMSELMKKGINVNATLIFSDSQAKNCLEAFKEGTKKYSKRFPQTTLPQGVISVFVSRFDRMLDEQLNQKAKFGIYNATNIYNQIQNANQSNVRTLFASTGVKGSNLPAHYYIKELLYPNSINTAPLDTIKAFMASGDFAPKALPSSDEISAFMLNAQESGVDYNRVCAQLLDEGLEAFVVAFDEILTSLS
ncbi:MULTISPECIES: transaldolase [Campylobacter]|uniref:transaldolase n=1 Tax=Campylobacter TaxID=194 RepID=UPI000A351C8F|nr:MULTISPECIES: transaldolase [unclassified Campylobacter]MBQ3167049.1 transaldolase [Campylobacter sp.]